MDDLNNMRLPKFNAGGVPNGYASSGGQPSGDMIVALDAATMAQFQRFMDNPTILFSDDQAIASSANRGNHVLATKGVS